MSATLIIDDPLNGGSEPGAWARALRDTQFTNPARTVERETAGLEVPPGPSIAAGNGEAPLPRAEAVKPGHHRTPTFNPERIDQ